MSTQLGWDILGNKQISQHFQIACQDKLNKQRKHVLSLGMRFIRIHLQEGIVMETEVKFVGEEKRTKGKKLGKNWKKSEEKIERNGKFPFLP